MDSTEVLSALEAELRVLDQKRAELAHAIETIRPIITGKASPKTASAVQRRRRRGKVSLGDKAVEHLRKVGQPMNTRDLAAAVGNPSKNPRSQYGTLFSALSRKLKDGTVKRAGSGLWAA